MKKLFNVQNGNLRALVTGRSLFRLPLSGTPFLLTSDSAVLSHSSKRLFKSFSAVPLAQAMNAVPDVCLFLFCLFVCFCFVLFV